MKNLLIILIVLFSFNACEKQENVNLLPDFETVNIELYGSYYGTFTHVEGVEFTYSDTTAVSYTIQVSDKTFEVQKELLGAYWNRESFVGQIHLVKHNLSFNDELDICIKNNLVDNKAYIFANVFVNDLKTKVELSDQTEFKIKLNRENPQGFNIIK